MAGKSVRVTCIVRLQIDCTSVWAADTTMGQIIKQAEDDANLRMRRLFEDSATNDKELSAKRDGTRGITFLGLERVVTQAIVEK